MSASGIEQARFKGMLESLQQQDPEIDLIKVYSKFVVVYLLQQEGANPGWRKANIEGPVYIVHRRTLPRYQLLVKNQFSTNDLLDTVHPSWELDCQKNYVFYKVEDTSKRIRGLWFHDDTERLKIESILEECKEEVQNIPLEAPAAPVPPSTRREQETNPLALATNPATSDPSQMDSLYAQFGLTRPSAGPGDSDTQDKITVSSSSVRAAMHALADDDTFIQSIMQKLKDTQASTR